jgi:hypothetical protein
LHESGIFWSEAWHADFGAILMNRHFLYALALASAAISPAFAADMLTKAPPPVAPIAPVTNWTGFYIGAQVGGAGLDPSCSTTVASPDEFMKAIMPRGSRPSVR